LYANQDARHRKITQKDEQSDDLKGKPPQRDLAIELRLLSAPDTCRFWISNSLPTELRNTANT
jgi:hypothetical protein